MNDVPPHEVVFCHSLYRFPLSSIVSSAGKMTSFRCCHFSYTFSFSKEASYGILSFFVYIFYVFFCAGCIWCGASCPPGNEMIGEVDMMGWRNRREKAHENRRTDL